MNGSNLENIPPVTNGQSDAPTIIKTDVGAKDGQNKCPKCGATDISLNVKNGKLRCNYCRYEFKHEKVIGLDEDISKLEGQVMGSGALDIIADTNDVITLKCSSCGSEVVIDTKEKSQARCHWCRSTLSINQQVPNGSIPDVVLPFNVSKEEAREKINQFVGKRKFFANSKFKKEFTTENIMGVYFPYMLVDVNSEVKLVGHGERLVRKYTRGSGDNKEIYYDADLYQVEREFDLLIDDLTIESSSDKLDKKSTDKTTNIINSIMPFDVENAVKWNANYLKGFTSEKRDTNVEVLKPLVDVQVKDIARFSANESLKEYDRGIAWQSESLSIKGEQWKAAYLPVWLYSYQQVNGNKKLLHYVAVNARTKETMGSVPIDMVKLFFVSFLVEIFGFFAMVKIEFNYNEIFLLSGVAFFLFIFATYRNSGARHKHELETKKELKNLRKVDKYLERRNGLKNSRIKGANNTSVSGQSTVDQMLEHLSAQSGIFDKINDNVNKEDK